MDLGVLDFCIDAHAAGNDDEALDAAAADIITAASYRYAHVAARFFSPHDGIAVLDSIRDPAQRQMLIRHMRNLLAGELFTAYGRGFEADIGR